MLPPGHATGDYAEDDKHTETSLAENLKAPSTWLRLLFMILFLALFGISRVVVFAVVVLQFF